MTIIAGETELVCGDGVERPGDQLTAIWRFDEIELPGGSHLPGEQKPVVNCVRYQIRRRGAAVRPEYGLGARRESLST